MVCVFNALILATYHGILLRMRGWRGYLLLFLWFPLWVGGLQAQVVRVHVLQEDASGVILQFERTDSLSLIEPVKVSVADLLRWGKGKLFSVYPLTLPVLATPDYQILDSEFEEWSLLHPVDSLLPEEVVQFSRLGMERKKPRVNLEVAWFTHRAGKLRRYQKVVVRVQWKLSAPVAHKVQGTNPHLQVHQSVLARGSWFKFPIRKAGVYVINRAFISALGLNPDKVDPEDIRIYGNGGRPLPALNSAPRPADLIENAVRVYGGGDGRFDEGDKVLFYARGPYGWEKNEQETWRHFVHPFSVHNYYFLTIKPGGQKVSFRSFPAWENVVRYSQVDSRFFVEEDLENLGQDGAGSGLDWLGWRLDTTVPERVMLDTLLTNLEAGEVRFKSRVAARANPAATLVFKVNDQVVAHVTPPPVPLSGAGAVEGNSAYARIVSFSHTLEASGALELSLRLQGGGNDPQGWFDWVEVTYPMRLEAQRGYLEWETPLQATGPMEFVLQGFTSAPEVWDVTNGAEVVRLEAVPSDAGAYRVQLMVTDAPRQLVAFDRTYQPYTLSEEVQSVPNQNLHGVTGYPTFVIVAPQALWEEAERLATYRQSQGLDVWLVDIEQVYNEFSGGVPDMRAVRDFFKFLYDRAPDEERMLRYALLFGDGHYDYRNITGTLAPNYIFPYETEETLYRIRSYTSDDYFGLLDDNEGLWIFPGDRTPSSERVDIGIGRLTVQTLEEARVAVDKIMHYERPETFGSWRMRYTFVADDGPAGNANNQDLHTINADVVAEAVEASHPELNLHKIYAIVYPAVTTAAGRRVPGAHDDLLRSVKEGTLLWNYSGHGNTEQLADERLFSVEDIDALDNYDRLTIFITATCSFGRWDMAERQSGAELLLTHPEGGAVALFSTVRLVYTSSGTTSYNVALNLALNEFLFERDENGLPMRLGDVLRLTKNTDRGAQGNNRKFNLLGDPTLRLGLPVQRVVVDSLNGIALTDTLAPLRALEEVHITGHVERVDGARDTAYDGVAEVSVFDAVRQVPIPEDMVRFTRGYFKVQNELIWRGKVEVKQGQFTASFIVPKDISYSYKPGKISVYVASDAMDGAGVSKQIIVGGTAEQPLADQEGPRITLFLNDSTFVDGGVAPPRSLLIVRLSDDSGINTVGAGVGHELLLVIDGEEEEAIDLSERFQGALNSYKQGEVRYELPVLEPGFHSLYVRAWDVVNNSSKAELTFEVVPEEELTLRNVFNYPNPTSGPTWFVFQHNQPPGTPAEVSVRIYTLSGWPVRTLSSEEILPNGVLEHSTVKIYWDGRDEDLDLLSTGVYLYRVRVETQSESGERNVAQHIEKLVIIR